MVQFWLVILQGEVKAVPHIVGVDVGPQVGPALVPQSLGQIVLFGSPQQTAALVKTLDIHLVGVDIPVRSSGGERNKLLKRSFAAVAIMFIRAFTYPHRDSKAAGDISGTKMGSSSSRGLSGR